MPDVLSFVERGWRGARECSLAVSREGLTVLHLVKGALEPGVRALIRPVDGVAVRDVPRPLFRLAAWGLMLRPWGARRARWALFDNERTLAQLRGVCERRGIVPVFVSQQADGYELIADGRPRAISDIFGIKSYGQGHAHSDH